MKKFLIIIFSINLSLGFGQNTSCVNEVSTSPTSPNNLNLPNDNHPDVAYDSLFLNHFNWIPFSPSGSLGDLQTTGFDHLGGDQRMLPLYNPALGFSSYYQYIRDELVMPTGGVGGVIPNHQEGWELIGVNLGFFPNSTPYTDVDGESNKHPRIPYVILYHRYLSKIRVFANIGDTWSEENAYQAVRIRLSHNVSNQKVYNGIFRLQEGLDRTLDQATIVRSVGALAQAPNDKQRWFSADFTVAYDPCVCYHPSAFNLDFELVKNINLKLYGRGIEVEEEIVDANGNFSQQDFFSGFEVDFENPEIVDGGFIMYQKMEDLFQDYIKRMEYYEAQLDSVNMHNKKVKRNLAIVKFAELAVRVGVAIATGGGSEAVAAKAQLAADAPDMVSGNDVKWKKVLKEAEKLLGKEIATFISGNFKTQDKPAVPNKPTATFSEMYFEGKLQQIDPKNGPTIYTPGTYGNSITEDIIDQHHYPVYNEALGVFALLEKPKVKVSYHDDFSDCDVIGQSYFEYSGLSFGYFEYVDLYMVNVNKNIQIQLDEELKYILNPALSIKDFSIDASFEILSSIHSGTENYGVENFSFGLIDFNLFSQIRSNPSNNVNIESIDFNIDEVEYFYLGDNKVEDGIKYNSTYLPINAFKNSTFSFGTESRFIFPPDIITSNYGASHLYQWNNSDYSSCNKLIERLSGSNWNHFEVDDIYLKLLINVTYEGEKSDGSPHEYTYMFTYKIDEDDIHWETENPLYPNLPGSAGDITQYPENLFLDGTTFDGSAVDGCIFIPGWNIYQCRTWNDIEISGEITIANNFGVMLVAGNEIIVHPESVTPPTMIWQIAPVLDFSNPMPPVDATYINTFCQNQNLYKAGASAMPIIETDSIIPTEESLEDNFAFTVFPNPTGGSTTVGIVLNESAVGELFITDINGRRLGSAFANQRLPEGKSEHQLPTESLASGIYLVHLFVDGVHHVKRIVKQ